MSVRNLDHLFNPRSVALIGASDRAGSLGALVAGHLMASAFNGPVWLVSRRHGEVRHQKAWPDVASLPGVPDLAIICTPAAGVPGLIGELGAKGCKAVAVLSAGPGPVEAWGPSWQALMLEAARPHLLRVLGPQSTGMLLPRLGLNASAAPLMPKAGRLAFVSQCAAVTTAMLDWAHARGVGFSKVVSLGDSLDVDVGDVLDHLACDPDTRAILMYLESVPSARKFMSAARAAARNKPVVLVKAARASADLDAVVDAAIRRAGMLRVATMQDLFGAAETLTRTRLPKGNRLLIVGNGRGPGLLAADAFAHQGGTMARLSDDTVSVLRKILPPARADNHPVDLGADAPVQRYVDSLPVLLKESGADALLLVNAPSASVPATELAHACAAALADAGLTVLTAWMGGALAAEARRICEGAGVPAFDTPEQAVQALGQLLQYRQNQLALIQTPISLPGQWSGHAQKVRHVLRRAMGAGRARLTEAEAVETLALYGIAVTPTAVRPGAHELVVKATVDPGFGPVIWFGQSGSAGDAFDDRAVALLPLNAVLARDLISRTRIAGLLSGHHERAAIDQDALTLVLIKVSQMMCQLGEIAEIHLDPLLADEQGAWATNARIMLGGDHLEGRDRLAIRPYPVELQTVVTLAAGRSVLLRPIRPEDEPALQRFYAEASAEDMRLRFFGWRDSVEHTELARYSQIDYDREMTFVAFDAMDEAEAHLLGYACALCDPDNLQAEFAVQVSHGVKGSGLATALMTTLINYQRDKGTSVMVGDCLGDNTAMRALAGRLGFQIRQDGNICRMVLPLSPVAPARSA